jgi:sugar lactone lactonase YvrE
MKIECICESQDGLGETPIWVEEEQSVYWADHVGPALGRNEQQLAHFPESGNLFAIHGLGVCGVPEPRFAG